MHISEYFHYMVTFPFLYHNVLVELLVVNIHITKILCIHSATISDIIERNLQWQKYFPKMAITIFLTSTCSSSQVTSLLSDQEVTSLPPIQPG